MSALICRKYLISVSFFFLIIASMHAEEKFFLFKEDMIVLKDRNHAIRQPNILLFNCHYGSGHKMATQGIKESLPDCNINVVNIYDQPLQPLDFVRGIATNWSNERLYNKMAKKEYNQLLNIAGKLGPKALFLQRTKVEKLLLDFVSRESPDMIISCIPLVNPMLLAVAQQLDIPFLVVTTDIDISYFCYGFNSNDITCDRNQFQITIPFAKNTWDLLFKKNVRKEVQESLHYGFGYPTRHAFSEIFEESTLNQLRREYSIHSDENVILVMMGGNTAQAASTYAKLLLTMDNKAIERIVGEGNPRNKIRMLCLCGEISEDENLNLMNQLNSLNDLRDKHNDRVIISACPGTPKIAELVSLPELCTVISKPGGCTVNEMIKKKVPMVYHISKVPLDWESGNMMYGLSRGLGRPFQINGKIGAKTRNHLKKVLSDTFSLHRKIQNGKASVSEASFDFTKNLRETTKEMLKVNEKACL